jgi:uncharacterized membrane protein/protein-disulfide isomerase
MKMEYYRNRSLTLGGLTIPRLLSFLSGAGMIAASVLTIQHFFAANYPETIFTGSFCDISAFFNCDSSAFSGIAQVMGVPLGYFGLFMGSLIVLGTIIPSEAFERTNKFLSLGNFLGVIALLLYSVFYLKSLCLLCSGYYLFSIFNFILFAVYGIDGDRASLLDRYFRPSFRLLVVFAMVALAGAYGFVLYHDARKQAQTGTALSIVKEYYELPKVNLPSYISPYWSVRSTEKFEDAAIQVVEYGDFLCSDCLYLNEQLQKLKQEFAGKINVAFQFFPLEGKCNQVVEKDIHPGACELACIAAAVPDRFAEIHDEIWANFRQARSPEWRAELARRYGVERAAGDPAVQEIVARSIRTGAEYERTSDKYSYGIRSTPTMIINNRMVIGTLPYHHLRAIFQALVEERESGSRKFLESWVPSPKARRKR